MARDRDTDTPRARNGAAAATAEQRFGAPETNGHGAATAMRADAAEAAANRKARLVLAERRTAYALLRTGLAVTVVPLSIFTVLAATTRFWRPGDAPWLFGTVVAVALGLLALGALLSAHAVRNIRHTDRVLADLQEGAACLETETLRERLE